MAKAAPEQAQPTTTDDLYAQWEAVASLPDPSPETQAFLRHSRVMRLQDDQAGTPQ